MTTEQHRFSLANYLADRAVSIGIALTCALSIGVAVRVLDCPMSAAILLASTVLAFFILDLAWGYLRRRRFYRAVEEALDDIERAYYLPDLVKRPLFADGKLLYDACADVAASDAALLSQQREATALNREYVELWTHEIKTPIAAAKLALSRMHGPDALALKQEVERIELACERALYSARTTELSRDYRIREIDLAQCCKSACKDLAHLLIQSGTQPVFDFEKETGVLGDEQWTCFVIKQVVSNSAKYQASTVTFATRPLEIGTPHGRIELSIADNGIGISNEELPNIFSRGFSGSNGRAEGKSTGMGLYLSAQVCQSMGVGLEASSAKGCGTTVTLSFPLDRSKLEG